MESKTILERAISFLNKWKKDYIFKTITGSLFSFGFTILFALYNGYLGIRLLSIWHSSICVFYILLAIIRGIILFAEKNIKAKCESEKIKGRRIAFRFSCAILLFLNLALICPISLMAKFEKPVNMSLIPAIAMAAYTTYKITIASVNIRKQRSRKHGNILIAELRTINFIDALVSVLTLQNTLIMVNNTKSNDSNMFVLSAVTSAVVYIIIVFITIRLITVSLKQQKIH